MELSFFFDPERPVALWLNLVIAFLTVSSVLELAVSYMRSIAPEVKALGVLERATLDEDSCSRLGATLPSRTATKRRVSDFLDSHRRRRPIDAEALTAVTTEEFRSRIPLSRTVAALLVLLGLAGTLWGLGIAIFQLSDTLSGSTVTTDGMKTAILGTLGGMQTAFSTTLAGVTGAVLLSFLIGGYRQQQSALLRRLEHLAATRLQPLFQVSEASLLGDATTHLQLISEIIEARFEDISEAIRERGSRLEGELRSGFVAIEESFAERSAHLISAVEDVRNATLEILGEREPGTPSLAEYVKTVQVATAGLERSVGSLGEMIPSLQSAIDDTIARNHKSLKDALTEHATQVHSILAQQAASADGLSVATDNAGVQLEELSGVMGRLSSTLENAGQASRKMEGLVEEMSRDIHDSIARGLSSVIADVSRLTEGSNDAQGRVMAALRDFEAQLNGTLQSLQGQGARVHQRSEELIGELRQTVRESMDQVGQVMAASTKSGHSDIANALRELAREFPSAPLTLPRLGPLPETRPPTGEQPRGGTAHLPPPAHDGGGNGPPAGNDRSTSTDSPTDGSGEPPNNPPFTGSA